MDENLYRSIRSVYSKFVYEILEWDSNGKEKMIDSGKILEFWNSKSLVKVMPLNCCKFKLIFKSSFTRSVCKALKQ